MKKVERDALSRTLNEAGIRGQVKKFVVVTKQALAETVTAVKAKVSPDDLWTEYNLNLQEAQLDRLV